MCARVCEARVHTWRPEDNFPSFLSFHHVAPSCCTQDTRLGVGAEPSRLPALFHFFMVQFCRRNRLILRLLFLFGNFLLFGVFNIFLSSISCRYCLLHPIYQILFLGLAFGWTLRIPFVCEGLGAVTVCRLSLAINYGQQKQYYSGCSTPCLLLS